MIGACAKQIVKATIVTPDGDVYTGYNDCENPQKVCPRKDMKSGEGYELCTSICRQTGHAEFNAIRNAELDTVGSVLYLDGHTHFCKDCKKAIRESRIAYAIIL